MVDNSAQTKAPTPHARAGAFASALASAMRHVRLRHLFLAAHEHCAELRLSLVQQAELLPHRQQREHLRPRDLLIHIETVRPRQSRQRIVPFRIVHPILLPSPRTMPGTSSLTPPTDNRAERAPADTGHEALKRRPP